VGRVINKVINSCCGKLFCPGENYQTFLGAWESRQQGQPELWCRWLAKKNRFAERFWNQKSRATAPELFDVGKIKTKRIR
jgi:hypothetical protein